MNKNHVSAFWRRRGLRRDVKARLIWVLVAGAWLAAQNAAQLHVVPGWAAAGDGGKCLVAQAHRHDRPHRNIPTRSQQDRRVPGQLQRFAPADRHQGLAPTRNCA
ncbi:hypothetical protein [Pseudorhodobacter sp.]|uniref:hypothetical protein n=1 Tax=Pseudorhodobacter sp. TaxID=1934400 RepID=UPI002AFF97F5|nr:hypothetical protein [Pseudorhodobacter sp.]